MSDDGIEEWGEIVPGQDGRFFTVLASSAAVDEPRRDGPGGEFFSPEVETCEEIGGDGYAGFDLDGVEGTGCGFDEGIDFMAFLVAEKMEGRLEAVVDLRLEQLGHNPVFEQGTALGVGGEV